LLVIVLVLLVDGAIAVALLAAAAEARLVADERWAIEGELVAKTALAQSRVHFATGAALPESVPQVISGTRPDGWDWSVEAVRHGDLVRLTAVAERHRADGLAVAGSRRTLLLRRLSSDTLQRLSTHASF
jgi:hypothetical protein